MSQTPKVKLVCCYEICAGHRLYNDNWSKEKNEAVYGHCANNHGHQYRIELCLTGHLDSETELLINGYDVDEIVKPFFKENLDHKFLNDDVDFFKEHQPTAEWIACWIYDSLKNYFPSHVELNQVRVFETPELYVEYPC